MPVNEGTGPAVVVPGQEGAYAVSKEQKEALLGLIGIWKTDHPLSDEEVERIIQEARMKKYG